MDKDLPARVRYWLNEEATHDCFFLVGSEDEATEKIGAVKALLMADSEPFRVMLGRGELAETKDIRVKDVEPETFRRFLACAYGASSIVIPKLTFEESAKLLYVLEKYLVYVIKPEIIDHMEKQFLPENLFDALSHSICYQTPRLRTKIIENLQFDFDKITKDDKFLKLDSNALLWILQQEKIFVNEIEIWNAVLRWAKHNTGSSDGQVLRSCISDFLKYIRFLTMDQDKFWEVVASTKILLEEEINDIAKSLAFNRPCSIKHLCWRRNNRYNLHVVTMKSCITKFPCQALIHCSVSSINGYPSTYRDSETHFWADHFWSLSVVKKQDLKNRNKLKVVVTCCGKTRNWNRSADVEVSIVNQSGKSDKILKFTKTFCPSASALGVSFKECDDLLNSDNGFMKDNMIIVLAKIQLRNT